MTTYKIAINTLAYVEKPEKPDWEELNTHFVNRDISFIDFCDAIYKGHPFAPWMNGKRKQENFVLAQHLAVDMDTQDYRSSLDALAEHPLVHQYGAIIYETPNYSPSAPKSRVVFLLDKPIENLEGYRIAQETVYSLFDGADHACVDPSRFFYGNGKLRRDGHTDGIWFDKYPLLPLADLRILARQFIHNTKHQEKSQRDTPAPKAEKPSNGIHAEKLTLAEAEAMLSRVNPYALDYSWWLRVIAALKHEFGDAAFALAKHWSDQPGKEPLTRHKWGSFRRGHGRPATIASVYKVVQDYAV